MLARVTLEVFALEIIRAMDLTTILNVCHHHRGFVYQHARFGPDQKSIEVHVRPRAGSAAVCSGCHKPAPGYDHLPERRFEFIPFWGILVFFLYSMRRVQAVLVDRRDWAGEACVWAAEKQVQDRVDHRGHLAPRSRALLPFCATTAMRGDARCAFHASSNITRRTAVMSLSGLPSTATISASLPSTSDPIRSSIASDSPPLAHSFTAA